MAGEMFVSVIVGFARTFSWLTVKLRLFNQASSMHLPKLVPLIRLGNSLTGAAFFS
jgi:hypothetical protein